MYLQRKHDIQPLQGTRITLFINNQAVPAVMGETVLSVLNAVGIRQLNKNDSQQLGGAYCGMGVCHSCLVQIDGRYKRRACQTLVKPDMKVQTQTNRIEQEGL